MEYKLYSDIGRGNVSEYGNCIWATISGLSVWQIILIYSNEKFILKLIIEMFMEKRMCAATSTMEALALHFIE